VFGGGHVVLPLLREAFVTPGWVSDNTFLAGYGAAQAVPGPLFTFAAYLGVVVNTSPHGLTGAALVSGSRGAYSLSRNEVAHESAGGRYPRSGCNAAAALDTTNVHRLFEPLE
jgi:hypothetical protein